MKRRSVIDRRLMQRRAELERRKARKTQPSPQRARILAVDVESPGSFWGGLWGFVSGLVGVHKRERAERDVAKKSGGLFFIPPSQEVR